MNTTMHPDPQRDPSLNLGTGPDSAESRNGSFAHGVLGSEGLLADQARYTDLVPRSYREAGVAQLGQNSPSALSVGLNPGDPRSGVFRGERYLMSSPNGRSTSTSEASPVFEGGQ
jgi:hypothetical protein